MESLEKHIVEQQLEDLERELVESWHLGEKASEMIGDAKRMPIGSGKTYALDWGNFSIARTPERFVINILTKKGEEVVRQKAIDNETHRLEN